MLVTACSLSSSFHLSSTWCARKNILFNVEFGLRSQRTNIGQSELIFSLRNNDLRRFGRETKTEVKSAGKPSTRTVSLKCKCGIKSEAKLRIVGGVESVPHSRPWMAALATNRNFLFCGGTVINNIYILTAAHCVIGRNPNEFHVILGLHDKWNAGQLHHGTYFIKSITIHPHYDQNTVDNDIALLQLTSHVDFNTRVLPACLPQFNADVAGVVGTISGWGMIIDSGPTSRVLREVSLPVLSNAACRSKYQNGAITTNMMCAGVSSGGKDACQGDSGGPMVYQADGRWYIIGVVSWGNGCAQANQPGVYTNVSRYVKWIYSQTANAVYCW
uniref:Peptidase S1 domain-containing protein n=1 Tax=Strigamia maritima TaxID=126957 RepID=T1JCW7_STRMM